MTWNLKTFRRHLMTRRFGQEAVYFAEIDSTNSWLLANCEQFALTGATVIADHQIAGRGRFDRQWQDVPGKSLLVSVLFRGVSPDRNSLLSMLPAIASAELLSRLLPYPQRVALKWPNDILLNERKLGGVLGQTVSQADGPVSVVGLGLNVNASQGDFTVELQRGATSLLLESGDEYEREALLAQILSVWEELYDLLREGGVNDLRARWEQFGPARGARLVREEAGSSFAGYYEGLGDQGQLRLRDDQGVIHEFYSGEVSV